MATNTFWELDPTQPFPTQHHRASSVLPSNPSQTPFTGSPSSLGTQHDPFGLMTRHSRTASSTGQLNMSHHFSPPPPLEIPLASLAVGGEMPSTPSHSHSPMSQESSPEPGSSPHPAIFDPDSSIQGLAGYYSAELKVLMGGPGSSPPNDMDSGSPASNPGPDDDRQPYHHGQIGAFRHFPRFDQASRPIVSDNWRAKHAAAASSAMPPDQHPSRAHFTYTPLRSPLPAPANHSTIAGFTQQPTSNPSLTPLSTPAAFPSAVHGHAHHPSTSSLVTSVTTYSPTSTEAEDGGDATSPSTDLVTAQLGALSLRSGAKGGGSPPRTTFAVTISAETEGYCFVRPNGTRTRLVPVDMLPFQLQGIPTQESGERLVALPVPAGVGGDGRSSNVQLLRAVAPPGGDGGDIIQTTIDRITATSPPHHSAPLPTTNHLTPTPSTTSSSTTPPKRMKIYCDKWVHEGVCAFTQQGCKYKHEMPSDRATQHALGLFLGYPAWWKRRQGELSRAVAPPAAAQKGALLPPREGFNAREEEDAGRGLAASRWGGREGLMMRPSWRAGGEGSGGEGLAGYDGAASPPDAGGEMVRYQPEVAAAAMGVWPWEEQVYVQQQGRGRRGMVEAFGGSPACAYAFHPTPTSPYGPIAPPPGTNPRHTINSHTVNNHTINSNIGPRPARELPNPYAGSLASSPVQAHDSGQSDGSSSHDDVL